MESYYKIGAGMGLKGEDLKKFIADSAQADEDRESRKAEREIKRLEAEQKLKDAEYREREAERNHKLDMARLNAEIKKIDLEKCNHAAAATSSNPLPPATRMLPHMIPFDHNKDDMDCYLTRFERFCTAQMWEKNLWSSILANLLTGPALEVYSKLPIEDINDYEVLKKALQQRYKLTADAFHQKFRNSPPEDLESSLQYLTRIRGYAEKWLELSGLSKTYEDTIQLFVIEQFLQMCSAEVSMYLKEQGITTVSEIASLADKYVAAHNYKSVYKKVFANSPSNASNSFTNKGPKSENSTYSIRTKNETPVARNNLFCNYCKKKNHTIKDCYKLKNRSGGQVNNICKSNNSLETIQGKVNGKMVQILKDSGCNTVLVSPQFIKRHQYSNKYSTVKCYCRNNVKVREAKVYIESPILKGLVVCYVPCNFTPEHDVIIGVRQKSIGKTVNAITRQQSRQSNILPTLKLENFDLEISHEDLIKIQSEDQSLKICFKQLEKKPSKFLMENHLLYKKPIHESDNLRLVVPKRLKNRILNLAHDGLFAGHHGIARTRYRIDKFFYWPNMGDDITRYCKSCTICQRTANKGKTVKAPLGEMPIIQEPFKRIAIDLVGPIGTEKTRKGNRFILTVMDFATRYPEAIALRNIDTKTVAEALLEIFSRLGIPQEILSDQGAQFVSNLMKEVCRLLQIKGITTTPYHPMCNGMVERFNATLKKTLIRLSEDQPRDWDRYLPAALFAYREVPSESTGFSPFDLMYGRSVRGPTEVLYELWTGHKQPEETKQSYLYVADLNNRLKQTMKLVSENLKKAHKSNERYYNKKAKLRSLKKGEKVLVLLPLHHDKLNMRWKGPYEIIEKKTPLTYVIKIDGKVKVLHINLLRKWEEREGKEEEKEVNAAVIFPEEEAEENEDHIDTIKIPSLIGSQTYKDITLGDNLSNEQKANLNQLFEAFSMVFTELPGKTDCIDHKIKTTSNDPVRSKPYKIPYSMQQTVKEEVDKMLSLGIIEPSTSPYASPIVLVKKPDNTHRFCVDYRKLNKITIFDAEPVPNPNSMYVKMRNSKFFTKIDLSSGYWQVPVSEEDRIKTAFICSEGLFQFIYMPFGLVNAGATFTKMMRKVLYGLNGVENYIDDIFVYTETFEEHIVLLHELFSRLARNNLTAKPSKCMVACSTVPFLGRVVGENCIQPLDTNVGKILNANVPKTKKQLRSFLGMCNYYRNFVENYSSLAMPLTNLTRKGSPNQVIFDNDALNSFQILKEKISSKPILQIPNFNSPFYLQCDASDTAMGAVILQEKNGDLLPIEFASKKFLPRERNYSTIEKECYAIYWSINHFQEYLYARYFILQTDHKPLEYLHTAKVSNPRLSRWALSLQPYKFTLQSIPGRDNCTADYLSRSE